ncbi:MAG TPA: SDR family oxidoreductase [Burkholderiales bacterium]|nr:SDR family oxidoreductase [Burkholderiales bacterium]
MDVASRFRLDGRTALVSGAGRGIGRACALALAEAGAEVLLLSRTPKEIDGVASEIISKGGKATAIACDVTDSQAVKKVFAGLASLDVLVNNAGSNLPEAFVEVSEEHLDRLLGLNVRAAFIVAQAAARTMLASPNRYGRAILNMSSQMGHVGAVNRSVYCLTKHALEGLTKAMALELAPHGIRVVSIAPTFVETPLTKPWLDTPDFGKWVRDRIPSGQVGQLEDVAAAVVFAASPAAALVTGSSLLVDGGWTAQ